MRDIFRNSSPGALTLEQAREQEINRARERRRQAEELAAQGRGGDTEIAHVARGEIVIPEVLQTPEVLELVRRAAAAQRIPFERLRVGSKRNSINPKTGVAEFDPYVVPGGPIEGITVAASRLPGDFGLPTLPLSWIGFAPEELNNGDPSESWYASPVPGPYKPYAVPGPPIQGPTVTARGRGSVIQQPNPQPGYRSFNPAGSSPRGFEQFPQNDPYSPYQNYGTPDEGRAQFATPDTIKWLTQVGRDWLRAGQKQTIGIGNMSLPSGEKYGHAGHTNGGQVDIRPIRADGTGSAVTWVRPDGTLNPDYDQEATRTYFKMLLDTGAVERIRFNDPAIVNDPDMKGGVISDRIDEENPLAPRQHDNHFHVDFRL